MQKRRRREAEGGSGRGTCAATPARPSASCRPTACARRMCALCPTYLYAPLLLPFMLSRATQPTPPIIRLASLELDFDTQPLPSGHLNGLVLESAYVWEA